MVLVNESIYYLDSVKTSAFNKVESVIKVSKIYCDDIIFFIIIIPFIATPLILTHTKRNLDFYIRLLFNIKLYHKIF